MAGYNHLVVVLLFLLVWRGVQDYLTSPRIMGSTLELHPLAVLFGVFAGGEVAGVIGVFLSIPVLATLRILWHTWRMMRRPSPLASGVPFFRRLPWSKARDVPIVLAVRKTPYSETAGGPA